MRILKLDTQEVVDLDENEAVRMILANVAVETTMPLTQPPQPAPPETAALDRSSETMTRPMPQPRKKPAEKRRRKR